MKKIKLVLAFCMITSIIGGLQKNVIAVETLPNKVENFCMNVILNGDKNNTKIINESKKITPLLKATRNIEKGESYKADYSATIAIPIENTGIQTRDSEGKVRNEAYVTASLSVYYEVSANKEKIKITTWAGSWTSTMSMNYSNQYTYCNDGIYSFYGGQVIKKYPSSYNFQYWTNWGWKDKIPTVPEAAAGPRVYSFVKATPAYMTASHEIEVFVTIP